MRRVATGSSPSWSPRGERIAFLGGRPTQIFVVSSSGRGRRAVTREPAGSRFFSAPAWLPDGRRVVYSARERVVPPPIP